MTGNDEKPGKHRPERTGDTDPELELKRAEEALALAHEEKVAAVARKTFVDRLAKGWERVHQRNHLADLFTNEYRRTH